MECSAGGKTVQVSAGEMARLTADGELVVEPFTAENIPAFVRDDADPELIGGAEEVPGPVATESPAGSESPEPSASPEPSESTEPSELLNLRRLRSFRCPGNSGDVALDDAGTRRRGPIVIHQFDNIGGIIIPMSMNHRSLYLGFTIGRRRISGSSK